MEEPKSEFVSGDGAALDWQNGDVYELMDELDIEFKSEGGLMGISFIVDRTTGKAIQTLSGFGPIHEVRDAIRRIAVDRGIPVMQEVW